MAVAFVKGLGSTSTAASNGGSLSLTTTGAVAAGNTIIFCGFSRLTNTPTTFTVSGGSLTWNDPVALFGSRSGNSITCAMGYANAPSGLATSTTLTGTWDLATGRSAVCAIEASGIATGTALDGNSTDTSAAETPSNTNVTGTTVMADEFAVAIWAMVQGSSPTSGTAGAQTGTATGGTVTEFFDVNTTGTNPLLAYGEYMVLTSTGTAKLDMVPSLTGAYCSVLATFQGVSAPAAPPEQIYNMTARNAVQRASLY